MTLIVAALGEDFAVLSADDRTTLKGGYGAITMRKDETKKLFEITDYVGILIYGAADEAYYYIKKYLKKSKNKKKGVTFIANDFSDFCKKEFLKQLNSFKKSSDFASILKDALPSFSTIVAGLDKKRTNFEPRIYILRGSSYFKVEEPQEKYATKGKPMWAEYIFKKAFNENMPLEKLNFLVVESIYETHIMDNEVGEPLQLAVIDRDGFKFKPGDLQRILGALKE